MSSGRPVEVDADTVTLLITMLDAWRLTQGRFDPTVLPALVAAGYTASIEDPRRLTILPPGDLRVGGMGEIDVDPDRRKSPCQPVSSSMPAASAKGSPLT